RSPSIFAENSTGCFQSNARRPKPSCAPARTRTVSTASACAAISIPSASRANLASTRASLGLADDQLDAARRGGALGLVEAGIRVGDGVDVERVAGLAERGGEGERARERQLPVGGEGAVRRRRRRIRVACDLDLVGDEAQRAGQFGRG